MDIHQIASIVLIAEKGSISKAAESLFITQSALTQQLNNVENELMFKLFKRKRSGVELTEQGRIFLEQGIMIMEQYDETLKQCRDLEDNAIRMVAEYETMYSFAASVANAFNSSCHKLHVTSHVCRLVDVVSKLCAGECDICFTASCKDVFMREDVCFIPLFQSRACCLLQPGDPLADKESVGFDDLRSRTVILVPPELDANYAVMRDFLAIREPSIRVLTQTGNFMIRNVDEESDAVIIGPQWRFDTVSKEDKVKVPLDWPYATQEGIAYIAPASHKLVPFIDEMIAAFSPGGFLDHLNVPA